MQLQLNEKNQELKQHGSYTFPVRVSVERQGQYAQGSFAWHWHPEVELTYFLEGEMIYKINQREYHVHAGDALFCNSNALHTGYMTDSNDCVYVAVTFHPRILYGYEASEIDTHFISPILMDGSFGSMYFNPDKEWMRQVIQHIKGIYEVSSKKTDFYPMQVQIALLELWLKIYQHSIRQRSTPDPRSAKDIARLRDILDYLHSHYSENVSLENIADSVHICKSECCRFFKKQMNQTLFEYLMEYRVSQSLSLLKAGISVTETCSICGFQNPAYFSRVFRKVMGCAPRDFLKNGAPRTTFSLPPARD